MALTAIALAAGAAATAYGASQSSKAAKGNQALSEQATEDELKRRKAAAVEANRLMDEYNDLRKERPGLTVEQFLGERVQALNNEELKATFRGLKQEDFDQAQTLADQASLGNVDSYNFLLDKINGGDSIEMLSRRNKIALSTSDVDAYNRALQLRSPSIPAGTVRFDNQGRFVEGQRADKQVFQTAYETSEQQRALQFDRLTTLLEQDRAVAERQQQKAQDFLQFSDYTGFANALESERRAQAIAFQLSDEANQFQLIRDYTNAAFSNQTAQPQYQSTQGANAITAAGIDLVGKSLASYASAKKS